MKFGELAKLATGDMWVVPQYWEYLEHRDVQEEYRQLSSPMHRPDRLRESNWSASSQGRCIREQQLTYLGFPKAKVDERLNNIFANGDYVHLRHQAAGLVAGYIKAVEVPVHVPELKLRGTMDGILSNGQGWEMKSINPYGYSKVKAFGPQATHKRQVQAYMLARPDIDAFRIVYENKADNDLKEFLEPRDPVMIGQIEEQLAQLNTATTKRELVPMKQACKNQEGTEYRQCPFRYICETAQYPAKLAIRTKSRKLSTAKSS